MKVFIVGMHRSGTSMVTGLLSLCGLYLGENLKRPMRENPKGFFEDNEFVNINKEILKQSGGSWKAPPVEIKVSDELRARMRTFMEKWPKDEIVGLKDPRISLTLREWLKVVDDEVRYVFVSRNVDEVAQSLHKRNGMAIDLARDLAAYYFEKLMESAQVRYLISTNYANYFDNWRDELQKICDFLELSIPADTSEIEAFIEPSLRHHKAA